MNIRKLQRTGGRSGSSFLVILPKDWIKRQQLEKGDPVVVSEREDGCLIVDPRLPKAGETRTTSIDMESNLRWAITSKYLLGFDEIRLRSKKPITNEQRDELKSIIKRFVALEVTEEREDANEIVIQCLVDPTTLPVHKTMKRMNLIASRMLDDGLDAFLKGDSDKGQDVASRDEEVNRLFFLIVRELRSTIQYPRISEAMGISPVEALDFRLAVQYIERVADLAVDIAIRANDPMDEHTTKMVEPIANRIREMLKKAVTNLFTFNAERVAWVIDEEKQLIKQIAELQENVLSSPQGQTHSQLYVIDSLLRIGEAARDIADLALPKS
ncbi:phosphate uptake regulator PhoU [Candidatus Thorarchaeota archaeon]|nr:MAG: phosphate uptake regulator PhoU [Candidatus Thorarchaeota archaeon]